MRKLLIATFLIGWFWGVRLQHAGGPVISVVVGPFITKALCVGDKEEGLAFFGQFFPILKVVDCQEKKEV